METATKTKSTLCLIEQILSYKTVFFNIVTTISYVFSPVMNFRLHAMLIKTCISGGDPQLLASLLNCTAHPPAHCAHIHCLVSRNTQQASVNVNGCHFFCMEEFSATPLLHTWAHVRHYFVRLPLFCHLSVTEQRHVMEYWWEGSTSTAIPPTSICWCRGPT